MVDDIDENFPTITFKEKPNQDKHWIKYWFNKNKPDRDVKVEPLKRKEERGIEQKPAEKRHHWDIAQDIITEQNKASLSIKWSVIPFEILFDEQFLTILCHL